MPVSTPHAEYSLRKPDWSKVRHFREGARAVRAMGEAYLPKLTGQTTDEYNAYKARAEVYGAVDRTIDGLDGAIFRKPPQIEIKGAAAEEFQKDVTLANQTLTEWIRSVVEEILTAGRFGVLVDFASAAAPNNDAAVKVNLVSGDRAYLVNYRAEEIINWETDVINGATRLVMVVLEECVTAKAANDPFVSVPVKRYRVLRLVNGAAFVEIWTKKTVSSPAPGDAGEIGNGVDQEYEMSTAPIPLTRRGTPLTEIPFFFLSPNGQQVSPQKPPLLDITELCSLHYMSSADYAHGLHWVGLPTPWITGCDPKDKIAVGPSSAIILGDPQAKVGMLEFTGTGLNALKDRLEGLESKMAALGARILEEQKKAAESGDALKLRQSGDASVLAGISDAVSRAVESIVARALWWGGTDAKEPEVKISLNMDFFATSMEPQLLTALMLAWQGGGISKDTFLWNLKKGEMLPEDRTVEEEIERIQNEPPPMRVGAPDPAGGKAA